VIDGLMHPGAERGKNALISDVAVSSCLRWLRIVVTAKTRQFEELAEKFVLRWRGRTP
jgi:hypothetical protein